MIVSMYRDPHATSMAQEEAEAAGLEDGVEWEYRQIEKTLQEAFPHERFIFKRDIKPRDLRNSPPHFYIFDIGGMCATDFNGAARRAWARDLADQIKDLPQCGFVPWSTMTRSSVRCAIDDLVLGEDCAEEPDNYETPVTLNLFLPSKSDERLFLGDEDCLKWMREFRSFSS
jgi:hypothetical protein